MRSTYLAFSYTCGAQAKENEKNKGWEMETLSDSSMKQKVIIHAHPSCEEYETREVQGTAKHLKGSKKCAGV